MPYEIKLKLKSQALDNELINKLQNDILRLVIFEYKLKSEEFEFTGSTVKGRFPRNDEPLALLSSDENKNTSEISLAEIVKRGLEKRKNKTLPPDSSI